MCRIRNVVTIWLLGHTLTIAAAGFEFYAGGSAGYSIHNAIDGDFVELATALTSSLRSEQEKSTIGWKVFGGVNLNRYLAIEAGYVDLGSTVVNNSATGFSDVYIYNIFDSSSYTLFASGGEPVTESSSVDTHTDCFTLDVVASYPVYSRLDLAASVGAFIWRADSNALVSLNTNTGMTVLRHDFDADGMDYKVGLGGRFHVTDKLMVRMDWDRYFGIKNLNNQLFSAGFQYNF